MNLLQTQSEQGDKNDPVNLCDYHHFLNLCLHECWLGNDLYLVSLLNGEP